MEMQTRMPVLPWHYYNMVMRCQDRDKKWERQGRCLHLKVSELTSGEKERYRGVKDEKEIPTHKISYYDFECYHTLEGRIKEDTENKLILEMGKGKEYEFLPLVSPS